MARRWLTGGMIAVLSTCLTGSAWAQDCGWSAPIPYGDLNGTVYAMTVFDDGSGPALYVGGTFSHAGGLLVNKIAKWNGSTWSALGPQGSPGIPFGYGVYALQVWDEDGAGPQPPALFVGGNFPTAGAGTTVNNIARWGLVGSSLAWRALGTGSVGTIGTVWGLCVFDDDGPQGPNAEALYIGGTFVSAGDLADVNRIVKWTGTSWQRLSTGCNDFVYTLTVFDDDGPQGGNLPALYVGGGFSTAGGVAVNRVARWSRVSGILTWQRMGTVTDYGTNASVHALKVYNNALYVGGQFTRAGDQNANRVARWSRVGSNLVWSTVGSGMDDGYVIAMEVFDPDPNDGDPGELFAGGTFLYAGGAYVSQVARWAGTAWSDAGGGTDNLVRAMTMFDVDGGGSELPALYVGGAFDRAGGFNVGRIARWSCEPFSYPLGDMDCSGAVDFDDIDAFVVALENPAVYALQYPDCNYLNGDMDGNGSVDFDDIDLFVDALGG